MGLLPENEGGDHGGDNKNTKSVGSVSVIADPSMVVRESAKSAAEAAESAAKALRHLCSLDGTMNLPSTRSQELLLSAAMAAASAASSCAASAAAIVGMAASKIVSTPDDGSAALVAQDAQHAQDTQRQRRLRESFGQLLRSKGFVWIATRQDLCGEWSQAGGVIRFTVGGPWYAALPEEAWPESSEDRRVIEKDFYGPSGDRRQELVFIGIDLKRDALTSALNECLVSEEEEKDMVQLPDPFAVWPSLDQILGDTESTSEPAVSGTVIEIDGGASQVQGILDTMTDSGDLCILQWHAPWCEPSVHACGEFERLAAGKPQVAMLRVDVDASPANTAFAMEKVMERPSARREGAKPVLRMGRKFPAFTVHHPPDLHPVEVISGPEFLNRLEEVIGSRGGDANKPSTSTDNAVKMLTAGASQLKTLLTEASNSGEPVVVVWLDKGESNPGAQAIHDPVSGFTCTLVQADVSATPQNAVLAKALKVTSFPTFHVYRGMKLEHRLEGDRATIQQLYRVLEGQRKATDGNGIVLERRAVITRDEFDPPSGKYAKPGATKRLADGRTAYFFPKMPCLRCGCPWWSSEEWNGRCLRCGWDCERQGYDDDSKPLPAFQKKWELFTNSIRQGKTPPWSSRP